MRPAGGHQPPRAGRGMGRDLGMRYMAPGAFTVLPPDGAPPPDPPSAPQPYRLTPNTKRHKHQSFAIIGEPSTNPNSRSDSPSGRVSPFKGRGFNPAGSRHASPAPSPTPPPNQHRHESHRNESPKHSSKIPQYSRRGSASAFGEKVTHYDPSIGSSENRRLSQSQPNLQGKKSKKPPISPRKKGAPAFQQLSPIVGSSPEPAHSMSSPSRIPKSRSTPPSRFVSPDRQGQHDGKPPLSRAPSRSVFRLANSRDNSRDGSPSQMPSTPIKVPARYRNIQAKVNSFNKPKPKVPPKPELSTVLSETDSSDVPNPSAKRPALARKDSVNKTSKPSALPKPTNNANSDSSTSTDNFNKNKATPRMSRRDSMKLINSNKVPDSNESKTKPSTSKPNSKPSSVEPKRKNEKHHGMSEESGVSNSNMSTPHHTVVASTTKTVTKPLKIDTKLDNAHYDKHQKVTPMVDGRVLSATSVSNALNKMSDSVLNSNTVIKDHGQSKLSPAANAIIAVGNEKKERDNFPETYKENNSNKMGNNTKLSGSDKNIGSSKNEQRNDTHNNMGDSNKSSSHQTPSKNNSLSGSQKNLNQMTTGQKSISQTPTSHVTTTGTIGHHTSRGPMTSVAMTTGHTTTTTSHTTTMTTTNQKTTDHTHTGHIPTSEMTTGQKPTGQTPIGQTTTNQTNTTGQKVFGQTPTHHSSTRPKLNDTRMDSKDSNNIHDQRMSDSNGKINNHTNHVGHTLTGHSRALETEVQKNLDKFITPGIAAANSVQKSVNDRIREARTMIASDVKPINIMVREKPSEVAVQSGNIRFQGMANGLDDRPSLPPSHEAHPPNDPPKEEPPPNACSRFLASCKNKLSCECCKKLETPNQENETEEKQTTGCFSCCSKKKEQEVRINVEGEEPKPTFCERLNCCKNSRKVEDSSSCFPIGKRKDSWATRRDSIFGGRQQDPPKKKCNCSKDCCKNFLKALFCINLCVWCASCCKKKPVETVSRKPSIISGKKKSLTPVTLPPPEDTKPKIDISLVEHSSHMKGAIPVLPVPLAWFCLVMNCILPGTGTIFSGMFCLCLGIPRFSQKDGAKQRIGAFLIDLIIGFSQAFTILFCLVGWGWAIWWGVIMVKVAKKHRKFKQLEAEEEANEAAAAAAVPVNNQNNRRDVERGHRRT